jgi:outer membrane biosynthesis protein TonB
MSEHPDEGSGVPRWQHWLLGGIAAAISGLAVVVLGLLVIAALRHGREPEAPPEVAVEAPVEPAPAPADPPPAPVVVETPAPAAPVEAPAASAPKGATTAPSPRTAPPPPEEEPDEAEEAEEPEEAPPPPPRSALVRVGVTGDAASVILDGDGGHHVLPAQVPPGAYLIRATFGEDTVTAGSVTIAPDGPITLSCRGGLKRCTPR